MTDIGPDPISMGQPTKPAQSLRTALESDDESVRLQAALAAGRAPAREYVDVLVEQCAVEPDFYVRDMLTWALTCHDSSMVVPRLLTELGSDVPQARAQSLHTLSKIGDPSTWPAVSASLLMDADDEVARAAWRTGAVLVPDEEVARLAETLATQFNRGDRDLQLSLSRAFVALGDGASAVVDRATTDPDPGVRAHAIATARLRQDPDADFDAAIAEAKRVFTLRGAPLVND